MANGFYLKFELANILAGVRAYRGLVCAIFLGVIDLIDGWLSVHGFIIIKPDLAGSILY
ncbi:MAG: hypothetical protein Q4B79_03875 [Moraxella sp.]|nr:hypothetical protein [Moraxella sp.]